jgi:hypothetical protein
MNGFLRTGVIETIYFVESLIKLSDGTRLVTGATVRVCIDGTWGAGAGTLAVDETDQWKYTLHADEAAALDTLVVAIDHADAVGPIGRDFRMMATTSFALTYQGAEFNERGGRIWYVAASGGSSTNSGTRALPLDSFANAQSGAVAYDTIHFLAGTHSGAITVTKTHLELRGDDWTAILSHTTGTTLTMAEFTTIRGLKVYTSDLSGLPVTASSKRGIRIIDCWLYGGQDAVLANSCPGFYMANCKLEGFWDGINVSSCYGFLIEDCYISTAGVYSSTLDARGVWCSLFSCGTIRRCRIASERVLEDSGHAVAIVVSGGNNNNPPIIHAAVTIQDCHLIATQSHASSTGDAICSSGSTQAGSQLPNQANLVNCSYYSTTAGGGEEIDIDATLDDSHVTVVGNKPDTSKLRVPANIRWMPFANSLNQLLALDGSGNPIAPASATTALQTSVDGVPTNAEFAAALPANFSLLGINGSGHVSRVTLTDTTTTNTDMRGTDGANTTAPDNASIAAILVDTADMQPKLGAPAVDLAADIAGVSGSYISDSGTAQTGAAGTLTLQAGAVATDDYYNYQILTLTGGTGAGQARIISDYVGSTKVATVNGNWATTPDGTTTYTVTAFGQIPGATAPTAIEVRQEIDSNSTQLAAVLTKTRKYTQLALRKDAGIAIDNAPELTEINADEGSGAGTFSNVTDSDEARRDNVGLAGVGLTEVTAGVEVEVIGGGPVEHEPVADINKRHLSRRQTGELNMNRSWKQGPDDTQWHSLNCSPILAGGKLLDGIAAPTVTGGDGKVSVGAYGVLGTDAKVRITTTGDAPVGTKATITLVVTPSVGAQKTIDCEFEVK